MIDASNAPPMHSNALRCIMNVSTTEYEEDNIEISTCVSHLEFTPFVADPKSCVHTTAHAPCTGVPNGTSRPDVTFVFRSRLIYLPHESKAITKIFQCVYGVAASSPSATVGTPGLMCPVRLCRQIVEPTPYCVSEPFYRTLLKG